MLLQEKLAHQGNLLFKKRSYLPYILIPILLIALKDSEILEKYSQKMETFWEVLCVLLSLFGLFIRVFTVGFVPKGTSGRNTKTQKAEVLNTTGMYSIVRHPIYLGNFIIFLGMLLFTQVWWLVLIGVLGFFLYYERIILAEEEFLHKKFGHQFLSWAERTPVFLPRFKNWQKPALPFSLKTVLKREYTTLFIITTYFPIVDTLADFINEGKLEIDTPWLILFIIGCLAYVILRSLKKLKMLEVEGR